MDTLQVLTPRVSKYKDYSTNEIRKNREFVGEGRVTGAIGKTAIKFTNSKDEEKSYYLIPAECNLPNIGKKSFSLQVHKGNLLNAIGKTKEDDFESEDELKKALAHFQKGEVYLTTIRPVPSTKVKGEIALLGSMSHLPANGVVTSVSGNEAIDLMSVFEDMDESETAQKNAEAESIG